MEQPVTDHIGGAGVGHAVTHFWRKDLAGAAGTELADITGMTPALKDTQSTKSQTIIVSRTGQGHPLQRALPLAASAFLVRETITVCGAEETAHVNGAATPGHAPRPAQHCAKAACRHS